MRISLSLIITLVYSMPVFAQPPATQLKNEPVTDDVQNVLTESVGLFGGIHLYNTYLNIGLLADSMTEGLYEPATVFQLLGSVVSPIEKVEAQFDKLAKCKLSKEDLEALARMKKIAGLLRKQGKELQAFWDTGKAENSKAYEATRQTAWKELNALLALEPKDEKLPTPRVTSPSKN